MTKIQDLKMQTLPLRWKEVQLGTCNFVLIESIFYQRAKQRAAGARFRPLPLGCTTGTLYILNITYIKTLHLSKSHVQSLNNPQTSEYNDFYIRTTSLWTNTWLHVAQWNRQLTICVHCVPQLLKYVSLYFHVMI